MDTEQWLRETRQYWNDQAATFDDEPDHGLRDPVVHRAWRDLLAKWLPLARAAVLDIGCGTGSLSLVLAGLGHVVTGIDLAPAMISQAETKAKAAGQQIRFEIMNAADPALPAASFDVILCRHLLWALPEPAQVLRRWAALLAPGGRLILVEGRWSTGGGLRSEEVVAALPPSFTTVSVEPLSHHSDLWGQAMTDERYMAIADRLPTP